MNLWHTSQEGKELCRASSGQAGNLLFLEAGTGVRDYVDGTQDFVAFWSKPGILLLFPLVSILRDLRPV